MNLLVFRLEGPLQSWGERSHWDHRDTALMPTKSGIVGLLGCCLGYPRGDERLAALSRALCVAIRADQPGRILTDYHTVMGTDGVLLNAQRKKRPGDTILTPRQYLQGAAFQIFITGEDDTLRMCEQAMLRPHWPPFLGRKSCPPAVPLVPRIVEYPSLEEAIHAYPIGRPGDKMTFSGEVVLQAEVECATGEGTDEEVIRLRPDEVVNAERDLYLNRRVYAISVRVKGESVCT